MLREHSLLALGLWGGDKHGPSPYHRRLLWGTTPKTNVWMNSPSYAVIKICEQGSFQCHHWGKAISPINCLFFLLKIFLASLVIFLNLVPIDSHPIWNSAIYAELVQIGEARMITNSPTSLLFCFVLVLSPSVISPLHDSFPPSTSFSFFQITFYNLIKPTNIQSVNCYLSFAHWLTWELTLFFFF